MEGGLYKYPMENILRTAMFLPTWGVNQRYFEVQKPTQALRSVKVPGNTFDIISKW
jgi:hypothetical protein